METAKKIIYKILMGIVALLSILTLYRFTKKPSEVKTVDDSIQKDNAEKIKEQETPLQESRETLEEVARKPTKRIPEEFAQKIEAWNKGE